VTCITVRSDSTCVHPCSHQASIMMSVIVRGCMYHTKLQCLFCRPHRAASGLLKRIHVDSSRIAEVCMDMCSVAHNEGIVIDFLYVTYVYLYRDVFLSVCACSFCPFQALVHCEGKSSRTTHNHQCCCDARGSGYI
jgi:hypothetical protein